MTDGRIPVGGFGGTQQRVGEAADDLADKLRQLASALADRATPQRVPFGRARFGFLRPRSPRGFVISRHDLEVLLPDGRVWTDGLPGPDGRRTGRYIDVRDAGGGNRASRMKAGGREFVYLGLTVGGYSFGVTDVDTRPRLCAIVSTGRDITLIDADAAFADIAHKAVGEKKVPGRN